MLSDGDCQSLCRSIYAGNSPFRSNRPFGEHIRLGFQSAVFIYIFQRAQQIIGRIFRKSLRICTGVDKPILIGESVISYIQFPLFLGNRVLRIIVQLVVDQFLHDGTKLHHAFDPAGGCRRKVSLPHDAVLTEVDIPIHHCIREVLYIGVCRNGFALQGQFFLRCQLLRFIMTADVLHSLMQLVSQIRSWNRNDRTFFLTVLGTFRCNLAQHHFRVVNEITVEGYALRCQPQMHPIRLDINGMVSLLQENDIRHYIRTGIGTKCVVGKSNGSQQFCPLCQILSRIWILGIHRITAGNKGHDTTGTNLIQCLGKEIVVNRKTEFIIGLIADTVVAKGHIAHGQIIEVAPVGGLKACYLDFRLRIQLLRNTPGDGIQFHTIQSASQHGIRQHTEEVADAHRRFQNIAFFKSHTVQHFIDCTDYGRAGVMRIQSRSPGCGIFFFRKSCFQLLIFACPGSFL